MYQSSNIGGYSVEERAEMLRKMQLVSNGFYAAVIKIGVHPFIEFCGIMNEYIKMCQNAEAQGIDFINAHAHSGLALPMRTFEAAYIGEKLGCIFGPSLQDPANRQAFLEKAELLQDFSNVPSPDR